MNDAEFFKQEIEKAEALARLERVAERAIKLSYQSALENGKDLPVGAVALRGSMIIGSGFAMDQYKGQHNQHAEVVAIAQAEQDFYMVPDTIVSTLEACTACQTHMATLRPLTTFAFVIPRATVAERGLVTPRPPMPITLPFDIIHLDNPSLQQKALAPLRRTTRDTATGIVTIDQDGVLADKQALYAQRI